MGLIGSEAEVEGDRKGGGGGGVFGSLKAKWRRRKEGRNVVVA